MGGANLKKILKEYGITQQLSAEGGRTSRGSMGLMIKYVDFLNAWNEEKAVDFTEIEDFWAEQVREYFRNQPFVLTADTCDLPLSTGLKIIWVKRKRSFSD